MHKSQYVPDLYKVISYFPLDGAASPLHRYCNTVYPAVNAPAYVLTPLLLTDTCTRDSSTLPYTTRAYTETINPPNRLSRGKSCCTPHPHRHITFNHVIRSLSPQSSDWGLSHGRARRTTASWLQTDRMRQIDECIICSMLLTPALCSSMRSVFEFLGTDLFASSGKISCYLSGHPYLRPGVCSYRQAL